MYRLRIEILDSEPAIWRSFWVRPGLTLEEAHGVLTQVMGWSGQADFRFKGHMRPGGDPVDCTSHSERLPALRLNHLLVGPGDSFLYTYDIAQGWIHRVSLEECREDGGTPAIPWCVAGEQACPPELCVGIWGYEDLLDRLDDPDDPDYDQLWQQAGYNFDPDRFELVEVNQRLQGQS